MIALQAENEEFKELMQQSINIPAAIEGPITLEMENGPEVAIFLAQNPDVCKELTGNVCIAGRGRGVEDFREAGSR